MKLTHTFVRLELIDPFVLSYGTFHHRDSCIVELSYEGQTGYGEATIITYYGMDRHSFDDALEALSAQPLPFDHPVNRWPIWKEQIGDHPFLLSALDCALWDLYARSLELPLYRVLETDPSAAPMSSFTLSGDPARIEEQLKLDRWPIYKIKMGTPADEDILHLIRDYAGPADIHIDANGGWTPQQAVHRCRSLEKIGVQFVEQPLSPEEDHHIPELMRQVHSELWADESARDERGFQFALSNYHGINLKLMKSGGISPVLQQIDTIRKAGKKVGLGCMTESSFGISALAHLAPQADALDMDGNLLLKNDPAIGAKMQKAGIDIPEGAGLACSWREQ